MSAFLSSFLLTFYKNQGKAIPKHLEGNHAVIETNAMRSRKTRESYYIAFYRIISLNMSGTVILRYRVKKKCVFRSWTSLSSQVSLKIKL